MWFCPVPWGMPSRTSYVVTLVIVGVLFEVLLFKLTMVNFTRESTAMTSAMINNVHLKSKSSAIIKLGVVTTGKAPSSNVSLKTQNSLLVVIILSRPTAVQTRNAIRNTWTKGYSGRPEVVLVKFSIGLTGLSKQLLADLAKEQEKYGDLLLIHNVKDSYYNLTVKVLYGFVLANKNYDFSYILKTDDDSFITLDRVVKELENRQSNKTLYWGAMQIHAPVQRVGKNAEYKWFLSNSYLPYAEGSCYILSRDLIKYLTLKPNKLMLYRNEDVSVGTWISPYKMERKNDPRFAQLAKCDDAILVHRVSRQHMYTLYDKYVRKRNVC